MARPVDISDETIMETAQTLFLEKGIAATEMKDIAAKAGIGRSSLYRHFETKEAIAFGTARKILTELTKVLEDRERNTETGAAEVRIILERYTQKMIENPSWIRFLDEFDQFFSDVYPAVKPASDYIVFNNKLSNGALDVALERGLCDGSLRYPDTTGFTARLLLNTILAMGQRVIPRIDHYMQEQGYALEYVTRLPELLVDGISTK